MFVGGCFFNGGGLDRCEIRQGDQLRRCSGSLYVENGTGNRLEKKDLRDIS